MFEVQLNVVEFEHVHSARRGALRVEPLNKVDYSRDVPTRRQVMYTVEPDPSQGRVFFTHLLTSLRPRGLHSVILTHRYDTSGLRRRPRRTNGVAGAGA